MVNKSIHNKEYKTVIRLLRNVREERGITQGQLAELLGCSQTVISKIETSERRLDIIELRKICMLLNISFIDFITLVERSLADDRS